MESLDEDYEMEALDEDCEMESLDEALEDCKTLLEQEKHQEKVLRHKRRLLMGLPNEAERLNKYKHQPERPMPESLLREDDVNYETIRSNVKKQVEGYDSKTKYHHDDMQIIHPRTDIKTVLFLIKDMTNQGLLHFAKLLTGGSVKLEKTRGKLKQVIKQNLLEYKTRKMKLSNDHLSFLKNPQVFHWNPESRFIPDSGSSHSAVYKILDVLEDLPTQTLLAMNRKLSKKKEDHILKLTPKKKGWPRDTLIQSLRKKCSILLSEHDEGCSLQEPLVKAMEVAGLTLKLIQGHFYATNFIRFPDEIIVLQNMIAMCIKLLDENMETEPPMFKKIKNLLYPDAKYSERTLRAYVKNWLMEYLFEFGDIDTIPPELLKVLAIIRKSSKCKNIIDEDVECILSLSASMKQVLWDVIPEHEFDLEFADVYMGDLEESDCDDVSGDEDNEEHMENNVSSSSNLNGLKVANSWRYHLVSFGDMERMETDVVTDTDPGSVKNTDTDLSGNRYLGVQDACDEVSMVAYRVIGHMLADFARMEGCELNSGDLCYLGVGNDFLKQKHSGEETTHEEILIKAVEELVPSFAKSEEEVDRVKELMGVKIVRQ